MEQIFLLAVLFLGAIWTLFGPIALVLAMVALGTVERRILALEEQLRQARGAQGEVFVTQPAARPADVDQPRDTLDAASVEAQRPPDLNTAPPTPPAALQTRRWQDLEEAIGTRWAVYVGGVALALGGLLLVRYSIEQGWFGPVARVLLGLALAMTLVIAGEVLRRREKRGNSAAPSAGAQAVSTLTPAVLTAAGTVAGFGAIYAAHALYHFFGPALAFVALGATGLAAMLSAALHGPALAGIGLAASLAAPLLVQSATPNPWPVVVYVAVVTVAAYGLARLRAWLWLAFTASAGAIVWSAAFLLDGPESAHANYLHIVIQAALASFVFALDRRIFVPENEATFDPLATCGPLAFGAVTAGILASEASSGLFDLGAMLCGTAVVAILATTGTLALSAAGTAVGAGVLVLSLLWIWPSSDAVYEPIEHSRNLQLLGTPLEPLRFIAFAALGTALVAGPSCLRLYRGNNLSPDMAQIYSGAAALTPLCTLALAFLRLTHSEISLPFGAIAGFLALAFLLLAIALQRRNSEHISDALQLGLGVMASSALAALALGLIFLFDRGMLTVALSLSALGAAIVESRLPIPALRWAVAGVGVLVAGRLLYDPRIVGGDLATTPVFNWLLFGYGVPAVAFGFAARAMRLARGEDTPVRVAQALSLMCAALLVFFEIRHALNGGDPYSKNSGLIEQGLFATAALAFSLVLMRLSASSQSPVLYIASLAFGVTSALVMLFGLGLFENPYLTDQAIEGGRIFNAIILSYGLPAVLAVLVARAADGVRPRWFVLGAWVEVLVLVFLLVTLETRRLFETEFIGWMRPPSDIENYTYSAVWLCFGIMLLGLGLWRGSRGMRLASGFFVVAAVTKVFVLGLAQLQGILRALSFVGLGATLIGIGLVYQKLVFRRLPP